MNPLPGVVETKVANSVWNFFQRWFSRNRDLKKEVESLKAQLAEERSGTQAFESLMAGLLCRPEDDNLYWKKDSKEGPYCPLCLHSDHKLIPVTHGNRDGVFYCRIHQHNFETEQRRQRNRIRIGSPVRQETDFSVWS